MLTIGLSILSTMTSSILAFIVTRLLKENRNIRNRRKEENKKKSEAIGDGVVCLLRVKLIEYHDKYTQLDNIPSYALSNWNDMYEAYVNLGGNGMIKKMNKEINQLPIK